MELQSVHDLAVKATLEAGAAIRGFFNDEYTVKYKGEDNPVTDADLAANAILERILREGLPEAGWLSEESVDNPERLSRRGCWIVDPLDGTREFTLGIPQFVVSVAYVWDNHAVVGVLYNPITEELFSGIVGVGAWYNNERVAVGEQEKLDGCKVVCSRTEMSKGWFDPWKDQLDLNPVGSVAYKFGLVAAGQADASNLSTSQTLLISATASDGIRPTSACASARELIISNQAWVRGISSNIARISSVPHALPYILESIMCTGITLLPFQSIFFLLL